MRVTAVFWNIHFLHKICILGCLCQTSLTEIKKDRKRDWKRSRKFHLFFFFRKRLAGVSMANLQTARNRIRGKYKTEAVSSVWSSAMAEFSYFWFFLFIFGKDKIWGKGRKVREKHFALCCGIAHGQSHPKPRPLDAALPCTTTLPRTFPLIWFGRQIFSIFCFCRKHIALNPLSRMDIFLR